MRFFLDKPFLTKTEELGLLATSDYLEVEWLINKNLCAVVYIIPRTRTSLSVISCWETTFDSVIEESDKDGVETIITTWPTMAKMLGNNLANSYNEATLLRLKDMDNGETKWFISSAVDSIDSNLLDSLFMAQIIQTIAIVVGKSMEIFIELQEHKPSRVRTRDHAISLSTLALTAIAGIFGVDLDALT
jgi:hypothetical protein